MTHELSMSLRQQGVRPHEGLFRYWVKSESVLGKEYLVDLESYFGVGQCDCPNFRFKFEPELAAGVQPDNANEYRCKHILLARRVLAYELLDGLIANRLKLNEKLTDRESASGSRPALG